MFALLTAMVLAGSALAAESALLFAPDGEPTPGLTHELTLAVHDGERPVVDPGLNLRASAGRVERVSVAETPGLWTVRWQAPARVSGPVRFEVLRSAGAPLTVELRLADPLAPGLSAPESVQALVGAPEPVTLRVVGADLDVEDLQVALPEGRLVGIAPTSGGLELRWEPGESREVRTVALGLRDGRSPQAPPLWVPVRLGARAPISVRTEPGSTLTVRVAGRTYGPVVAAADGTASVQVEVRPGETVGEATLEDPAGNRQRTTVPLIRNPRPSLTLLLSGPVHPGRAPPALWVHAMDAAGRAWAGEAPRCRSSGGAEAELLPQGPGTWRGVLPAVQEGTLDLRVDCTLEGDRASASLRVPVGQGSAARLVLQVYPRELSADLPVAQVRALLEDARGDRLAPEGVTLGASHGVLGEQRVEAGALRADLTVDTSFPEDEVVAAWRPPAGRGAVWWLQAWVAPGPQGLRVVGRALDRDGLPLAGVEVSLEGAGASQRGGTDLQGWVEFGLPAPAQAAVVRLRAGEVQAQRLWWPYAPSEAPARGAPDLEARETVRVAAGRVSRIDVRVSPSQLTLGASAQALIEVLLEDRAGTPVVDEPVVVEVSQGVVSAPELRPDGRLVLRYTPPQGLVAGPVEIWVRSERGSFPETRASLELLARPLVWAPGVSAGWVTSFGALNAPQLGAMLDRRLLVRDRPLYLRFSLTHHHERQQVQDPDRDGEFDLSLRVFTASAGVVLRQERGRVGLWAGAGAALGPYLLTATQGGEALIRGWGTSLPGPWVCAGAGWRLPGGEVLIETRATGLQARGAQTGYEGPIGGLAFGLGYRIIY